MGRYLFASNAHTVPDQARQVFGYEAEYPDIYKSMEVDVLAAVGTGKNEGLAMKQEHC